MRTSSAPAPSELPQKKGKKRAALSRDLSDLLVELSIAAHRFAIYPPDHPSLEPAAENAIRSLTRILQDRRELPLGVAKRQLIIEGVATDEGHPVLSDLARRLHGHHLGSVRFERGTTLEELKELLQALAEEPERVGSAIGLLPAGDRPAWTHISVVPLGYEELELDEAELDEEELSRARQLWVTLAQAALQTDTLEDGDVPDGRKLARIIEDQGGEESYDRVIVSYLHQLAEELSGAEGRAAEQSRHFVSELVEELPQETLRRLIHLGGAYPQRMRFLLDVNDSQLTARSVVRILEAAAEVEQETISGSLTRLLRKLATHAEGRSRRLRAEAESAIRETVEELIKDWELEDPNPEAYTRMLDEMSQASPLLQDRFDGDEGLPGGERIIQMALEVDVGGPALKQAVAELLDQGKIGRIFEILDEAPEGSRVAAELLEHVTSPAQLRRILAGEEIDEEGLQALVDRMGPATVDLLFQYLVESESRSIRRRAFDCLVRLDTDLTEPILKNLRDDRWYVQRNMLALLAETGLRPEGFDPMAHMKQGDVRVKREALPLAVRDPRTRSRALASALAEQDERLVRMALLELQEDLPDTLVPVVVRRILDADAFPQLRSLAARALGANRSALAREALLNLCFRKGFFFRGSRLASKGPEVLAALAALARNWPDDPKVKKALERARKSRDPKIRAALSTGAAKA